MTREEVRENLVNGEFEMFVELAEEHAGAVERLVFVVNAYRRIHRESGRTRAETGELVIDLFETIEDSRSWLESINAMHG